MILFVTPLNTISYCAVTLNEKGVYKKFFRRGARRENILRFHTAGRMFASGMKTFRVTSRKDGRSVAIPIEPGLTLAQHLYTAGAFTGRALCSGAGRCGLCQVRFTARAPVPLPEEAERIAPARLEAGWRLACKRPPVPDAEVLADLDGNEFLTAMP